jgi:serine/threonine protein kinase
MIGKTIGPYEIRSALGAGGMGEVYRARDSRLGRDVALKILPETLARDPDRLARFRREAQVLASLNHAHIGAIHGLEDLDGVPVLVLELVEGPTLADRIVEGRIPVREALDVARQIAEALEAAHEHGIVHRDLKPANIKLRDDGAVKVLDFGLAKLVGPAIDDVGRVLPSGPAGSQEQDPAYAVSQSPTMTSPAMTRIGVILGTASYMSPEQARGRVVDRGADIWAWACVLFEMLAGAQAFGGADITEVIAAVVRGEPDWSRLPVETPDGVGRLLRRCLEKDPKRRLADMRDARFALEDAQSDVQRAPPSPSASNRRERLLWAGALLLCLAGAAAVLWRADTGPVPGPAKEMRVEITTPPTTDLVSVAISPDGEKLVYVASSNGRPMLWLRSLVSGEARSLAGTDGASFPFWSPNSRSIGFFANERLYRIDIDGGSLRALTSAPVGAGATWSREGVILFTMVPDAPIARVSDAGGEAAFVPGPARGGGGNRFPQFLPDGRHYLYYVAETATRGVYVGTLDGPERRRLFDADAAAVFVPPGQILFVRAGTLLAQGFDAATLALEGDAASLAMGIAVDTAGAPAVSASAVGSIVYRIGSSNRQRQLVWLDRSGVQIGEAFPPDSASPLNPSLSPDGRQLALNRIIGGNADLWLVDLERRGALTRVTDAPTPDIDPVWSPDGKRLVYAGMVQGNFDLLERSPTTASDQSVLLTSPLAEVPLDWSRDGQFVLYRKQDPSTGIDVWALPMKGDRTPIPVARTSADERTAQFSPDGRWVAYESNESGRYEIYLQRFRGPETKTVVSTDGGIQPRWGPDGRELFYVAPDARLMVVPLRLQAAGNIEPASPMPLFQTRVNGTPTGGSGVEYAISNDGKRFLMNTLVEQTAAPITLILNRP